jgi:undecaprenyl pyrophosphate phosphatase UppP
VLIHLTLYLTTGVKDVASVKPGFSSSISRLIGLSCVGVKRLFAKQFVLFVE